MTNNKSILRYKLINKKINKICLTKKKKRNS